MADISSCSLMFTRVVCYNLEICYDCASMLRQVRRSRYREGTMYGIWQSCVSWEMPYTEYGGMAVFPSYPLLKLTYILPLMLAKIEKIWRCYRHSRY